MRRLIATTGPVLALLALLALAGLIRFTPTN